MEGGRRRARDVLLKKTGFVVLNRGWLKEDVLLRAQNANTYFYSNNIP